MNKFRKFGSRADILIELTKAYQYNDECIKQIQMCKKIISLYESMYLDMSGDTTGLTIIKRWIFKFIFYDRFKQVKKIIDSQNLKVEDIDAISQSA